MLLIETTVLIETTGAAMRAWRVELGAGIQVIGFQRGAVKEVLNNHGKEVLYDDEKVYMIRKCFTTMRRCM